MSLVATRQYNWRSLQSLHNQAQLDDDHQPESNTFPTTRNKSNHAFSNLLLSQQARQPKDPIV
jgi:hypothetical protein